MFDAGIVDAFDAPQPLSDADLLPSCVGIGVDAWFVDQMTVVVGKEIGPSKFFTTDFVLLVLIWSLAKLFLPMFFAQNKKSALLQNGVKPGAECARSLAVFFFRGNHPPCFFAAAALALCVCVIQFPHCLKHDFVGVVSEEEFQFQCLYLSPLLEHPLVVEEAACQCQFVDGGGHVARSG